MSDHPKFILKYHLHCSDFHLQDLFTLQTSFMMFLKNYKNISYQAVILHELNISGTKILSHDHEPLMN